MASQDTIVNRLMDVIEDRKRNLPEKSYTTTLFKGGVAKIGAKITEEAGEVIEAATELGEAGHRHLVHEASDLLFHLCVLLAHQSISWSEVEDELARRFGISGLDEKASRVPTSR